jgi:hypothetical protein
MKTCTVCKQPRPLDSFHRARRGSETRQGRCKDCARETQRQARLADPEKNRANAREYVRGLRDQVVDALGASCASCGYSANRLGLEIDHVAEDGAEDRRSRVNGLARHAYYRHLLRCIEEGDHGLQMLCGTCHSIKTRTARRTA